MGCNQILTFCICTVSDAVMLHVEITNSAEGWCQLKELTADGSTECPLTCCFSFSFFLLIFFYSEIHERSNTLREERLPCFGDWVGDASPRVSPVGLCICWPPVAAFALHPPGQENDTTQDVLRDTQHDGVRPRKQVSLGLGLCVE